MVAVSLLWLLQRLPTHSRDYTGDCEENTNDMSNQVSTSVKEGAEKVRFREEVREGGWLRRAFVVSWFWARLFRGRGASWENVGSKARNHEKK